MIKFASFKPWTGNDLRRSWRDLDNAVMNIEDQDTKDRINNAIDMMQREVDNLADCRNEIEHESSRLRDLATALFAFLPWYAVVPIKQRLEVRNWCRDNLSDFETFDYSNQSVFVVPTEPDQVMFKMRWSEVMEQ